MTAKEIQLAIEEFDRAHPAANPLANSTLDTAQAQIRVMLEVAYQLATLVEATDARSRRPSAFITGSIPRA